MRSVICLISLLMTSQVFAYGVGVLTHPMTMKKRLVHAEFAGLLTNGSGVGLQARYVQRINQKLKFDAGFGFGGGDRSSRFFGSLDYELYPDYAKQPRVSTRLSLSTASEFDKRINTLALTPTASKGFSFWGHEAFPFVAIPTGLSLNSTEQTYEFNAAISAGVTGKIPLKALKKMTASAELNLNIANSYTGLFFGLAYPIN